MTKTLVQKTDQYQIARSDAQTFCMNQDTLHEMYYACWQKLGHPVHQHPVVDMFLNAFGEWQDVTRGIPL